MIGLGGGEVTDPDAPVPRERVALALDLTDRARLTDLVARLAPEIGVMKIGSIPWAAFGPELVRELVRTSDVFLDIKLHDIPNTVTGAVLEAARLGVRMLTVHASGGPRMIAAAAQAAEASVRSGSVRPRILAVTVLTHMDASELEQTGVTRAVEQQVLALATLAMDAGADGLVCSAHEVRMLRDKLGTKPYLVVPGIRPAGTATGDQRRTATPREAIAAGADLLVVGRAILDAPDPLAAARAIRAAA